MHQANVQSFIMVAFCLKYRKHDSTRVQASTSLNMFSLVKAHMNFLDAAGKSITDPTRLQVLHADHLDQLVRSLAMQVGKTSLEDATNALALVRQTSFSDDAKLKLSNIILGCGSADTCSQSTVKEVLKPQEHLWFHNYLTDKDWACLTNKSITIGVKIDAIVRRSCAIGLLSLSEQTAKAVTAVLIVGHGQTCDLSGCYEHLVNVKTAFKRMRQHKDPALKASLRCFPKDVKQFLEARPDTYSADEQPVDCPLDEKAIEQLRISMPARQTHASLGLKSPLASTALQLTTPSRTNSAQAMAMQFLMPLAQAIMGDASGGNNSKMPSLKRKGTPLALLDGSLDDADEQSSGSQQLSLDNPQHPKRVAPDAGETPAIAVQREPPARDGDAKKTVSDAVKAVQEALAHKACVAASKRSAGGADAAGDAPAEGGSDVNDGRSTPKGKSKANPKAKSKATPKAKSKAAPTSKATLAKSTAAAAKPKGSRPIVSGKRPAMPPLKKIAPIKYLTCTVYSSEKDRKWRAISSANKRYDVSFSWKGGADSWNRCMAWCEANTE